MTSNPMIESYFAALANQLSDLPQAKRDEVVRELRAHVLTGWSRSPFPQTTIAVLC